ncbi:hypothetical protein OH76DRAFT_1478311 [Lentinus brumalis]|uniref:Structure-specific endonuclease subunit SLX4 n=1 Tax=Lentinus brumalis TaxID=2498619 RepID=A0A371DT20_9APHY|nr:hypothetical protein OH76DRAFT_1478311 [Polyporus brumalis]
MPALVFSRSQSVASQTNSDQTEDYVEDSEPEREARRLREKACRKKTRSIVRPRPTGEVIELSDSGTSSASLAQSSPAQTHVQPLIVVDISDGSDFSSYRKPQGHGEVSAHGDVEGSVDASEDTTLDETLPSIRKILGLPKSAKPTAGPQDASSKLVREQVPEVPLPSNPEPLSAESDDEDEGPLKISRFAYTDPNAARRTASKTPSSSGRESSTPEVVSAPGKAKRVPTPPLHAFAQDFTDADLSRIRRCVSCETSWTVRKSVANKMKHIEVCARKKKLTHETIRVLLRKELNNLPPVASTSKLPAVPAPVAPETLLEDALKDAQKKKGRRPQVLQTVKAVQETRSNILDRARQLLQDTRNTAHSAAAATGMASPTQVFGMSSIADTTQVFGRSRIAVSRVQTGIVRTGADIAATSNVSPLTQIFSTSALGAGTSSAGHASADLEPPPATQVFAPSKFANARRVTEVPAPNDGDPLDEPISLHDTSEDDERGRSSPRTIVISSSPSLNASPRPRSASPMSPANAGHSTPPFVRMPSPAPLGWSPSPVGDSARPPTADQYTPEDPGYDVQDDYHYAEKDWNNGLWDQADGACLHYVPDENGAGPSNPSSRVHAPAPRKLGTILEDLPIPGPSGTAEQAPVAEPPKKKAKTRRKKATVAEDGDAEAQIGKDISQEDLNAKLKEAILKDETLHLRVLRYEPIHFDVFMKLATDLGIPAKRSGLKGKVRTFLDQKAIHFYGADPSKSRTKRTRHP